MEVVWAFLRLGVSSFGGPIAHLAYFRREFVDRRKWLEEAEFAQLLALCMGQAAIHGLKLLAVAVVVRSTWRLP